LLQKSISSQTLFSAPGEAAENVTATAIGATTVTATAEVTEADPHQGGRLPLTTVEVGPGVTTDLDPDLILHVSSLNYGSVVDKILMFFYWFYV
jgi:hypothetical protein